MSGGETVAVGKYFYSVVARGESRIHIPVNAYGHFLVGVFNGALSGAFHGASVNLECASVSEQSAFRGDNTHIEGFHAGGRCVVGADRKVDTELTSLRDVFLILAFLVVGMERDIGDVELFGKLHGLCQLSVACGCLGDLRGKLLVFLLNLSDFLL